MPAWSSVARSAWDQLGCVSDFAGQDSGGLMGEVRGGFEREVGWDGSLVRGSRRAVRG